MSKYSHIHVDDRATARKACNRHDNTIEPDDIPPDYLEEIKRSLHQTKVMMTHAEAENIEKQTQEQAMSVEWNIQHRKYITASWVGAIAKMRKTTKQAKKVQELLYMCV